MKEKKAALRAAEWKYDDKMDKTMAQLHYHQYSHINGNCLSIPTDLQKQFGHHNKQKQLSVS